jgi:tetratricopeptide (TPR) repeat protein
MIHLESGRYLDAAADVQRLVEVGAYEDAVAVAERLVAASPDSREAWMSLGRAALAQGDYGQALAAFRKAADVDRPTSALLCCQAIALNLLDRPEEALKCAEQAVTMDERDVIAWEQLGFAAGNMGHHERALAAFRKAAEVDRPTSARLCYQAVALNALKRWDEALTCAEQAVAMDEKNARAWEELGVTAGVMGYHDRALAAFRKTAEAGGSSGRLREMEATLLRHLGRAQESLSVLDQALALEADNPHLWRAKAWTLLELDQFEQALECLEQARQKGATLRMYHHDRGDLLLLGGRYAEALKDLEEGLRAEPGDWDLQGDRLIALGCLGQQGPLMEALPATLAKVRVPATSSPSVCQYAYDVALNALRRGEKGICLGLLCASLEMEPWTSSDWFGKQLGNFLRRALEAQPQAFIGLVQVLSERLKDEKALKLLEPFFAASEFLQTRNLAILERLFPEVRELVLDIVKRVEPALYEQSKRLI